MNDMVDVLIIGAGASGAAVAWSLAEAGLRVVCLEQGDWVKQEQLPQQRPRLGGALPLRLLAQPEPPALPADYPVNDDDSPFTPLNFNAVGGSTIHWSARISRASTRPTSASARWTASPMTGR